MRLKALMGAALALLAAACSGGGETATTGTTGIDGARIIKADGGEWLSYGRTYDEQRYSPLDQINPGNIGELGLAWYADMDTARGQEATPLVIDGKIYVTTAWSKVKAYDAVTGKPLWDFDPKVPGETGVKACCDVVNRGLAAWGNMLFLGTLDGRLIALDRGTGREIWSKVTVDQGKSYTVTGAPRVIDGMVIIGNGGAEFGVRGFVAAYDAATGKQLWKFYTVPDRPGANEAEYLKTAESSWKGEYWNIGGGGTVWDAMAYDPELGLLYVGVGNGSPWNQAYRSPGGGDNLYLSSIVAIRVKTGEYAWHYQTTPGETWDYTATQHIMLADLEIDGKLRKVLMQAPKNGFFYVIDRATGEFISANNFVPVNWATGVDQTTGSTDREPGSAGRQDRQALCRLARPAGCAQLASDGVRRQAETGVHPRADHCLSLYPGGGMEAFETGLQRRHGYREQRDARRQRGARDGAQGDQGRADRLGPGRAEGALARHPGRAVERRRAGDRRRAGVPGQCDGQFRRV